MSEVLTKDCPDKMPVIPSKKKITNSRLILMPQKYIFFSYKKIEKRLFTISNFPDYFVSTFLAKTKHTLSIVNSPLSIEKMYFCACNFLKWKTKKLL